MITENVSTLKIHRLTQEQYDRELEAGNINENEIYLTPDEAGDIDISELTQEEIDAICTFDGDIVDSTPIATRSSVGLVSAGNCLQIDEEGALSVVPFTDEEIESICEFDEGITEANVIPKATRTAFGCVKVGNGLAIDASGRLYVTGDVVSTGGTGGGNGIGGSVPIGTILEYGAEEPPENWLLLNGQAVDRVAYSELFQLYGTTYGEGDGSTTFNLPDFRGKVPVGLDEADTDFNTLGKTGGEKTHKLTVDELASHSHSTLRTASATAGSAVYIPSTSGTGSGVDTTNTGGDQPHNNLQPYIVVNYIVKAKAEVADLTLTEEKELRELLWTNPDSTTEFVAQTINLDLSDATHVMIDYRAVAANETVSTIIIKKDQFDYLTWDRYPQTNNKTMIRYSRKATVSGNGIVFEAGGTKTINAEDYTADNTVCIPMNIYLVKDKIDVTTAVVTDKGQHTDLLWENASPTAEFAAQTISVDLSGYDYVEIVFGENNANNIIRHEETIEIGKNGRLFYTGVGTTGGGIYNRRVSAVTETNITFEAGYGTWNSWTGATTVDNTISIPLEIYGIKHNAATTSTIMGDYIIEEGSDDIWTWRKWNSGIAECWCIQEVNVTFEQTTAYTSHSGAITGISYPIGLFIIAPVVNATANGETHCYYSGTNGGNNEKLPNFYLMRSASASTTTYKINVCYQVKGNWK